jgi:hypothetical protein
MGGEARTQPNRLIAASKNSFEEARSVRAGWPILESFSDSRVGYHEPKSSCFVSGHEFTRAEPNPKMIGLQPLWLAFPAPIFRLFSPHPILQPKQRQPGAKSGGSSGLQATETLHPTKPASAAGLSLRQAGVVGRGFNPGIDPSTQFKSDRRRISSLRPLVANKSRRLHPR